MKKMPPKLITPHGISWLASQVGQPINKLVHDGLDMKVCVFKDLSEAPLSSIEIKLSRDEC
ncbi:hypothetical protein LINPERPRIM_LOCUS12986 [Linum perenne]